jgi:geranylgeranyl diphosphate synthase, type II
MVGGQALDLEGEGRALARAELDTLHRAKTGALLTASLRMGGLAGAPAPRLAALEALRAGHRARLPGGRRHPGCHGVAEALGKQPSDADLDKSTYVRLLGVEGARAEAAALVAEALAALAGAGVTPRPSAALARYVVERDH